MKIVSQLNPQGYFVEAVVADESPLEPGQYLIPGGAIDVAPPIIPVNKRALWTGNAWVLVDPTPDAEQDPEQPVSPSDQIEALERQYMLPRPVRDVLLPLMEREAAALGVTPAQLRIVNSGYRRVKELDEQIAALRALL